MADHPDTDRWKMCKVAAVGNRFEEDMVAQALESAGIPFWVRRYTDTAYDGLFIPQKGWASIMVPVEFREKAREIVDDVKRDFESGGSETTGE